MSDQSFPFHDESTALANAPVDRVFAYLDDPRALAAHMGKSSTMLLGSRMSRDVDADGGRVSGSKIRMHGSMNYSLPTNAPGSWLGRLLGGVYARWCTKQMADDVARHFNLLCIKESP